MSGLAELLLLIAPTMKSAMMLAPPVTAPTTARFQCVNVRESMPYTAPATKPTTALTDAAINATIQ
jgi:hypothetical protein